MQKLQNWVTTSVASPHTINFYGFPGARFSGSDLQVVPCTGDLTGNSSPSRKLRLASTQKKRHFQSNPTTLINSSCFCCPSPPFHLRPCDSALHFPPKRKAITLKWSSGLTCEVALDPQVAHAEPKDRQLVQAGANVVTEGQQVRQPVQLHVQPIPVALRRVGLDHRISFGGGLLPDGKTAKTTTAKFVLALHLDGGLANKYTQLRVTL